MWGRWHHIIRLVRAFFLVDRQWINLVLLSLGENKEGVTTGGELLKITQHAKTGKSNAQIASCPMLRQQQ